MPTITKKKASGPRARSPRAGAAPVPVPVPAKPSFRERMQVAREEAILDAVNQLLASKGYDAMTVDEVAAEAGVAKASLYRHYPGKEALASAAMVRVLNDALAHLEALDPAAKPIDSLQESVRWTLRAQLRGRMPSLPSENSALRAALLADPVYLDRLLAVSDRLERWIAAAQKQGTVDPALPPVVVLYTLFARGCDPVVGFLRSTGQYTDDEIVELVTRTCFSGLRR
jgi:TetR/AcrR family transcriptional regulator of autoinduction and epiphytic fitness